MNGVVRLILVRHGEAVANTELRYLGSRDNALTERGRWQAAQLGQALAPLPLAAVSASPLRRETDTAAAIARAQGLAVMSEPCLVEGALGTWEGLRRSPDDAEQHRRWEADRACAPPGGESLASVQARVLACIHELTERHDGKTVPGQPRRADQGAPLRGAGGTAHCGRHMFLDPATISVVDWGAPAVLRLFNAHHHLRWMAARWMDAEAREGPRN